MLKTLLAAGYRGVTIKLVTSHQDSIHPWTSPSIEVEIWELARPVDIRYELEKAAIAYANAPPPPLDDAFALNLLAAALAYAGLTAQ